MPPTPLPTVRTYEDNDRRGVIAVAARAFSIDPMFDYLSRDRLHQHQWLPSLFRAYLSDLGPNGTSWIATNGDGVVGLAGWLAPDALPRGAKREGLLAARLFPAVVRGAHTTAAIRLGLAIEQKHPKEPHWYLSLLAVDPTLQGRGVGSKLIQPGLDAADADGLPCYLETQKESNVSWYARFGFELTEKIELRSIPPVWLLTRPAR